MKSFILFAILVSQVSNANPTIIPGGPITLSLESLDLVQPFLNHATELSTLVENGDELLSVSRKQYTETAIYSLVAGHCTIDPARICFPTRELNIELGFALPGRKTDRATIEVLAPHTPMIENSNNHYEAMSILTAAANVSSDVRSLMNHGNTLISAQIQFISPYFSRFNLLVKQCRREIEFATCSGGATLSISATTKYSGVTSVTSYSSDLRLN